MRRHLRSAHTTTQSLRLGRAGAPVQLPEMKELTTWQTTGFGPKALAEKYGEGIARRIYEKTEDNVVIRADVAPPRAD